MNPRRSKPVLLAAALLGVWASAAFGQTFRYEAKPRLDGGATSKPLADPAPRLMEPAEELNHPLPRRRYLDPRYRGRAAELTELESHRLAARAAESRVRARTAQAEPIAPGTPSGDPF